MLHPAPCGASSGIQGSSAARHGRHVGCGGHLVVEHGLWLASQLNGSWLASLQNMGRGWHLAEHG